MTFWGIKSNEIMEASSDRATLYLTRTLLDYYLLDIFNDIYIAWGTQAWGALGFSLYGIIGPDDDELTYVLMIHRET